MSVNPACSQEAFDRAIAKWRKRLGSEHVKDTTADIALFAATTLPSAPAPAAVLEPGSVEEVVDTVRIAKQLRVSLYPISTGRNWGYGDACPTGPSQVLVDLRRMNRIIELDETMAYVVIEPGVTQGQLAEYLQAKGAKLRVDCTGAGPDTSIVGNVLERGFGHSAYGNRVQTVCGMQIVLADGRILETGFGHYGNAKAARLYPSGLGPALDGLFTQSNFGIVTRLGLWLMPCPQKVELFVYVIEDPGRLGAVVDALRRLRLDGTIRSVVHLANDLRLISGLKRFPWDELDGRTALPEEVRLKLRRQTGIGAWGLSGSLAGDRRGVAASRAALRRSLRGSGGKLLFLTDRKLRFAEFAARHFCFGARGDNLRQRLLTARGVLDLNTGRPTAEFLRGAYWRSRSGRQVTPGGADPARDNCGLIWLSPVIPMTGASVEHFCGLVEPVFRQWGFEFLLTLSTITDRAMGAVMTVAFDKQSPDEARRAETCYASLLQLCMENGYLPYRLGIQSMGEIDRGSSVFWDVASEIKAALDPAGIIAPGRYQAVAAREVP